MNCDECLEWIHTGTTGQRQAARRHLLTCPTCAASESRLAPLLTSLAEPVELSAADRQRWLAAAADAEPGPPIKPTRRWPAWVAVAAAAVLAVGMFLLSRRPLAPTEQPITQVDVAKVDTVPPVEQRPAEDGTVHSVPIAAIDALELDRLSGGVALLEAELQQVALQVEVAATRREVERVLAEFGKQQVQPEVVP